MKYCDKQRKIFKQSYSYNEHSKLADLLVYYVNKNYKENKPKETYVFGFKFYNFLFVINDFWYIGCYASKSNQWCFFKQVNLQFVPITQQDANTFISSVLNDRNAKSLFKTTNCCYEALKFHSGKRLHKLLMQILLIGYKIKIKKDKFIISYGQKIVAELLLKRVSLDSNKKNWVIHFINENKIIFAYESIKFRKQSNVKYILDILKEIK